MPSSKIPTCPFKLQPTAYYEGLENGWKHTPERVRYPVEWRGVTRQAETYFTIVFRVRKDSQFMKSSMRAGVWNGFVEGEWQSPAEFEHPHDAFCWASQLDGEVVPTIREFCYA